LAENTHDDGREQAHHGAHRSFLYAGELGYRRNEHGECTAAE
jgi:hypothetical protein